MQAFSIKLVIHKGKALYFGSVHFKQTETFGVTISGVKSMHLNQYDRDVNEFRKNYQNVRRPKINIALKHGQSLVLGEDMKSDTAIIFDSISTSLSMPSP